MAMPLTRRAAPVLPLAAGLPGTTDALGRTIAVQAPAGRIVIGFDVDEFTASRMARAQ
jgi:hypothetical protein